MPQSRPLSVNVPATGVLFAESVHARDFQMTARTDPFHKCLYVLRGGVVFTEAARDPVTVSAGMLLVIPAGVEHRIADQQASTLLLLCLGSGFVSREPELPVLWAELADRRDRRIAVSRPARQQVETVWRRALLERIRTRPGGLAVTRALAVQLLVTLVRLPVLSPAPDPYSRVAAVSREMESTFYDEWTLDRGAARAGVSRRHFSMLFRKVRGCTFWEHLIDLRLSHAAELLQQGDHSVTGVVFACGFGDVSQFYRLFRARFRQPPKQWALATTAVRCSPPGDNTSAGGATGRSRAKAGPRRPAARAR